MRNTLDSPRRSFLLPIICAWAFCLFVLPVHAATFTVDSADTTYATPGDGICADGNGVCTLRAAIQEANALANDIRLPAGNVFILTIDGPGEDMAGTGDPWNTTIDASGLLSGDRDRALDARLDLARINLTGGRTEDEEGGAMNIRRDTNMDIGTAFLTDCDIFGNSTFSSGIGVSSFAAWGGIHNAGHLDATNCTISGNSVNGNGINGGGISNSGMATFRDSRIENNQTTSPDANGGGIRNRGGIKDRYWIEISGRTAFNRTNNTKNNDFYITRLDTRYGLRFQLSDNLFLDPYLAFNLVRDFGGREHNEVYWNNNISWGPGIRLSYQFDDKDNYPWINSFNINPFIEHLSQEDSLDKGKEKIPDNVSSNNFLTGVNSWFSASSQPYNNTIFWVEAWSQLTYRSTNFGSKGENDYYIINLQPSFGLKWKFNNFSVQPYYRPWLIADFGKNRWNEYSWNNNISHGPGIRYSFDKLNKLVQYSSIFFFAEYTNIHYLSEAEENDNIKGSSSHDYLIGIQLWLPFGATKSRVVFN